jgi:hypothetical protein
MGWFDWLHALQQRPGRAKSMKKKMKRPPPALPTGYAEIWRFLEAADQEAASRQALARSLGLSTHTIQRILVRGDVPHFPDAQNARVLRSWVRILTRLAFHARVQPQRWIEAVGIQWTNEVRGVSEAAAGRAVARQAAGAPERRGTPGRAGEHRGLEGGLARDGRLRVGIARRAGFSAPIGAYRRPLFEELTRRTLVALSSEYRIEMETVDEGDLLSGLTGPSPVFDVGVGIVETAGRRVLGLEFVVLPGLAMRLSALTLRSAGDDLKPPSWREVTLPATSRGWPGIDAAAETLFIVLPDGVAANFLRSQCGVASERLLEIGTSGPDGIASVLASETERRRGRPVVLLADEVTAMGAARAAGPKYTAQFLRGEPEEFPVYPLAIAFGPGARLGPDLLTRGLKEMFAAAPTQSADLYAAFLSGGILSREAVTLLDPLGLRGLVALVDFSEASAAFKRALVGRLIADLARGVEEKLKVSRLVPAGASQAEVGRRMAMALLRRIVPSEWKEWAGEVDAGRPDALVSAFCLSCSAPLDDELNRGVSDRYCRFCSDESGALRPREDVEQILARWFGHWQRDLTAEQALERARGYMHAMPAWCNP